MFNGRKVCALCNQKIGFFDEHIKYKNGQVAHKECVEGGYRPALLLEP